MKRILHFGGVLLALGMLLASCNMVPFDSTVSGNSTEQESSNISSVTIGVKSIDNSRTILPADWTADLAGKLTYALWAKKNGGGTDYAVKETFSYDQLTNGTAKVNLELTYWDLKLVGYMTSSGGTAGEKDSQDTGKPCLERELLRVDFTTGAKSVTFDLKPALTKENGAPTDATGSVNVSIAWLTKQPKRLELGIYGPNTSTQDIVAGEADAITDSNTSAELFETFTEDDFADAGGNAHKVAWALEDKVTAGMYKFAVVFYDSESDGKVIGYYIDWLYVDGGNLSRATINYGDKFNTIPDNPTWLAVKTFFKPEALKSGETAKTTYLAEFHWNDNSTNETGFELVITDNDESEPNEYVVNPDALKTPDEKIRSLIPLDSEIKTLSPTLSAEKNTLDAGSTSVVLKLDTQKLYTAKIRAINNFTPDYDDADDDDFCDNLNCNGDGQGRSYAPIVGDDKQFGMFTVNYTLDKDSVVVFGEGIGDKTNIVDTKNYVVGYNYSDQQQNLMTDDPLEYPHISKDANNFAYWTDTATSLPLKVIEAENIKNLTLTPNWTGVEVLVAVTFPSYATTARVKLVADRNEGETIEFKWEEGGDGIKVDAGESFDEVDFELTYSIDGTEITGPGVTAGITEFTWNPTKAPEPGYYRLQITGKYKAGFESDPDEDRELTLCGNIYINVVN